LYRASTEIVFQAGHFLRFEMEQEEPHRHDWRVRAVVESEELDENQLVMDFHLLAKLIEQVVQPFTKVEMINELPEFSGSNPSTEILARYIFDNLSPVLPGEVKLKEVIVWETDDCRAAYRRNCN
jgi:6-pyruvoyltetrahydropterin/6-carboxytetrahydropterin synthase